MVLHLEQGFLLALVRLNGNVDREVLILSEGDWPRVGGHASGPRSRRAIEHSVHGKNKLECLAAELGLGRQAGVADQITLLNTQHSARGFGKYHVGVNGYAVEFRRHIVDRNVSRSAALRRGNEVGSALMNCPDKVSAGAGRLKRIMSFGIGSGGSGIGHAGLNVHQDNVVARRGLAAGLVGYCSRQGCGLRHGA